MGSALSSFSSSSSCASPWSEEQIEASFSTNYYAARAKFRLRARQAGAVVHVLPLDVPELDLTIDIAVVERSKSRVLVHISGTHGVEGFAGSAIQAALLSRLAQQQEEAAGDAEAPTLILVHALNPFGFAELRRFNENNVDLNRNFIAPTKFASIARTQDCSGYIEIKSMLNPHDPRTWSEWFWPRAAWLLAAKGYGTLKKSIVAGNYVFPETIFYGGAKQEQSVELLLQFLRTKLDLKVLERLAIIDVHTGLGACGVDSISISPTKLASLHKQELGVNALIEGVDYHPAFSGYQEMYGTSRVPELLGIAMDKCVAMCQEFGTVSGVFVTKALVEENAMYHHFPDARRIPFAEKLRDVFYLHSNPFWKQQIVTRGTVVFDTVERLMMRQDK